MKTSARKLAALYAALIMASGAIPSMATTITPITIEQKEGGGDKAQHNAQNYWKQFQFDRATGYPIRDLLSAQALERIEVTTITNLPNKDTRSPMVSDGTNLYYTLRFGGTYGYGGIYKFDPYSSNITLLASLNATNGGDAWGQLCVHNGTLRGMAYLGGPNGGSQFGTTYALNTDGSNFRMEIAFNGSNGNGGFGRFATSDGYRWYGTSIGGGTYGSGVVFCLTNGVMEWVYSLNGTSGGLPYSGVTVGSDGYLYLVTARGGSSDMGVYARITTNGSSYTVLRHCDSGDAYPEVPLIEMPNGKLLVGSVAHSSQGSYSWINRDGTGYQLLSSFGGSTRVYPQPLTLNHDGTAWGTTWYGGASNAGSIHRIDNDGVVVTAYEFTNTTAPNGLKIAPDGQFYTITRQTDPRTIIAISYPTEPQIISGDLYCDGLHLGFLTSKGQLYEHWQSSDLVSWQLKDQFEATDGISYVVSTNVMAQTVAHNRIGVNVSYVHTNYLARMKHGTIHKDQFTYRERRTTNDCLPIIPPCTNNCGEGNPPPLPRNSLRARSVPRWTFARHVTE